MPHYFFSVHDGNRLKDSVGIDLPNVRAAQQEAVSQLLEMLQTNPDRFWDAASWTVAVTNETGAALFVLTLFCSILPRLEEID